MEFEIRDFRGQANLLETGFLHGLPESLTWIAIPRRPDVSSRVFAKRVILSVLLISIGLVGWLLRERIVSPPAILAHGNLADGSEYCVVQAYKDICEPGWWVGVYQRDSFGTWHLRTIRECDAPLRKASVFSGKDFFVVSGDGKGPAWTVPSGLSPVDFEKLAPDDRSEYARPECPPEHLVRQLMENFY